MASVFDVAKYILEIRGIMTAMKLQKLVYYSQAWSLAWTEEPLFDEEIEAWANGPVVRSLFEQHRGRFKVSVSDLPDGDSSVLTEDQKETIDSVLEFYGNKSPQWLSELTHIEDPWKNARNGIPDYVRDNTIISKASLLEYYANL